MGQRALRHARVDGVGGVLDDRHAAYLRHLIQSRSAIVESAGQDDADYLSPIAIGGAAKQWIDRRARPVLARAFGQ